MSLVDHIADGWDPDPARSMSLRAPAYTDRRWFEVDQRHILTRTWQWCCHGEKLREPGSYVAIEVAEQPVVVVRNDNGDLAAFYNVCQHRAHHLLEGEGTARAIVCP